MSRATDLLAALARAYNLTETSGVDDPGVREALLDVRDAATGGEAVQAEVFRDGLVPVGSDPDRDRVPGVLAQDLAALGVSRMTVPGDVGAAQLERFLGALRDAVEGGGITLRFDAATVEPEDARSVTSLYGEPGAAEGDVEATGRDRDVMDLVVSLASEEESGEGAASGTSDVEPEVTGPPLGDVEEEGGGAEEPELAAEEGAEATPDAAEAVAEGDAGAVEAPAVEEGPEGELGEEEEAPDPIEELIDDLMASYRDASGSELDEVEEEIRQEADRLRGEGALDAVARLVEELIIAAVEGEVPEDAVDLAREYAGHGVMARIAIHLGAARHEERRQALTEVACRLGREMASTIADALTDAPDRSARRTYIEAMEAMGDDALEIAETMAGDSRWFIARNGVGLLGELGDQDAIQHLTSPLAHSDARLRKETVVALAKLGGEDAGNLCVGMLSDPDPDVRASAAMAVGVLKVHKAQRQLLARLDAEENPDVQIEVLKALGQLGDPGAVPAIEKRAVGGLFSRAPTAVRIAAYRALAAIGTPHARSLLESATDDRDLEIRTVVRSLVERREKAGAAADVEPDVETQEEAALEPDPGTRVELD